MPRGRRTTDRPGVMGRKPVKTSNPAAEKEERKRLFLERLTQTGVVTEAAKAAGVDRSTAQQWRKKDPEFSDGWRAALEQATGALEVEARRRAVDGVAEPVYYKGEVAGTIQRYSDTLLIFLLKGAKPNKYRERIEQKHSGKLEHDHTHTVNAADLDDDTLARIALKGHKA